MASASTTTPSSVVYITDSAGQGSGVLISPDEVLTAAHVVYGSQSGFASDIEVSAGYDAGSAPLGTVSGVVAHAEPIDDANEEISPQQSQSDFALIHLSEPITSAGTMAIGTGFAGGAVTLSGYPESGQGAPVSSGETVSKDPTLSVLEGAPIAGYPGSLGSSGGPVWIDRSGVQTVVGLTSSVDTDGSQGTFVQLTAADEQQIAAWMAQDDGSSAAVAAASTQSIDAIVTGIDRSAGARFGGSPLGPAGALDVAGALLTASNQSNGTLSVATLITGAEQQLAQSSAPAGRQIAYLAGLALGLGGASPSASSLMSEISAALPGATPSRSEDMIGLGGLREGEHLARVYGI